MRLASLVADHRILWSSPEGRFLIVERDAMTLQVLKLDAGAPAPPLPLPSDLASQARPLDWGSAARIVGPANVEKLVEALVDQCWDKMSQVALIFINAPDQWPARTSFHQQAHERGTTLSTRGTLGDATPLDTFGLGGLTTTKLANEIKANGKFASIEDLVKRVREASRDYIRRQMILVLIAELTTGSPRAMFFARKDGKVLFRGQPPPPKRPSPDDEDDDADFRPQQPTRYRGF